jgi:hypothetical protein
MTAGGGVSREREKDRREGEEKKGQEWMVREAMREASEE